MNGREKIITAGKKLFGHRGYNNVSIREIAEEANIAESSVYVHFSHKINILYEIFKTGWSTINNRISNRLLTIHHPRKSLNAIFDEILNIFEEDSDLCRVFILESRRAEEHLVVDELIRFVKLLEKIIIEGVNRGIFRNDFSTSAAKEGAKGIGEDLILGWLWKEMSDYPGNYNREEAQQMCDIFLKGMYTDTELLKQMDYKEIIKFVKAIEEKKSTGGSPISFYSDG